MRSVNSERIGVTMALIHLVSGLFLLSLTMPTDIDVKTFVVCCDDGNIYEYDAFARIEKKEICEILLGNLHGVEK